MSTSYYDKSNVTVKVSVLKGNVTIAEHHLAFEDMHSWVFDTGNPISFFPEGIVLKGKLIES